MSAIHTCTLVVEFNYSSKPNASLGSVWIYNGDGSDDLLGDIPLDKSPNWVKIVGPINYDDAAAILAALKRFFEESGVIVIDKGIAD